MLEIQRELNWTEPFPKILGTYVTLPPKVVLWRNPDISPKNLYHFSVRSDKCSASYSSDSLHLMDFRYAVLLLSHIKWTWENTPEMVTKVCMVMKELSIHNVCGFKSFSFHGILIPALNGNHVVLFDMDCVKECPNEYVLPTLHKDVTWAITPDISPLRITQHVQNIFPPRIYVTDSNDPIQVVIDECIIEEFRLDPINISDWPIKLEKFGFRRPNHHLHENSLEYPYQTIFWDTFLPAYGSYINLPENTVLWRGYNVSHPAISDLPACYCDKETAKEYKTDTHVLGSFATSRSLKLLDFRFLKVLLNDLNLQRNVLDTAENSWIMAFLGELFEGIVDGVVSHSELILFNPLKSVVQLTVPRMAQISIADLIREQSPAPITMRARGLESFCGSALDTFNDLFNRGDPCTIRQYKEAVKEGKRLQKRIALIGLTYDHELPKRKK